MSERDENGRFTGNELSSEEARELARKRWDNRKRSREVTDDLLIEAGYPDPEDAPAAVRLLAKLAAKEGSGAVQAITQFLRQTKQDEAGLGQQPKLERGRPCPTCKRIFWDEINVDHSKLELLIDLLRVDVENGKGVQYR